MPETPTEAYARGVAAGKVSIRLDHHDASLATIEKVLAKVATVEADLTLAVQELAGELKASRETAEALAIALREAKETAEATARKEADQIEKTTKEQERTAALGWSPVTKVFATLTVISGFIALYVSLIRPSNG